MNEHDRRQMTPERRANVALVFQVFGISDIVLGVLVGVLGSIFIDGDTMINVVPVIAGAVLVVMGAGVIWFGRVRFGRPSAGDRASSVVERD